MAGAYQRGLDRPQLHLDLADDAGQAHAAGRGPESLGLQFRRTAQTRAVGQQQLDLAHTVGKRAVDVVALAVHVCRNTAAQRDEAGAGRGTGEPAGGNADFKQFGQGRPRLGADYAADGIEAPPRLRWRRRHRRGPGHGR